MQDEFPLLEPHKKMCFRMENELALHSGEVIKSCKEVEGKYPDLLADAKDRPLWAFGPFHMLLESLESISSSSCNMTCHECLEFLDKQDVNSVIFVSFGSTTTLSQEQINELALGLEQSNHRFIWVLRKGSDNKEKLREKDGKIELPDGFEERVKGRGMVVNWAPQLDILRHSSTGGFLSHCGWNSCIESMSMGVPLATWPVSYDQPFNAIFVTNLLKIGIPVKR
ncbi:Zeatin O-xylosyltransferase [Capsicum annuum]|nr:Zeatin O-xylosyltransferase [Capsicum annuum]KAF3620823.1 Zeatin O-xylosyltransferase [Capsicum annuum]